jgi:hypothetical protein
VSDERQPRGMHPLRSVDILKPLRRPAGFAAGAALQAKRLGTRFHGRDSSAPDHPPAAPYR